MAASAILDYDANKHLSGLRRCVIELQNFERGLDARLPGGEEIVDAYIPHMLRRCKESAGKILIAEVDGEVAGFALVLTGVKTGELEDGDLEFALVADLVVTRTHRRQGLGRKLIAHAEAHARKSGATHLRIGVLAANTGADRLYSAMGYSAWHIEREKAL